MFVLNYFYFAVLLLVMLKYLRAKGRYVADPYVKRLKHWMTGREIFFLILFSTCLLALSAPAGLDLMALRLLVLEILCIVVINRTSQRVTWTPSLAIYFAFILWIICGLSYAPAPSYGIRVISKYLYAPLIMLAASVLVRRPETAMLALVWGRRVALIALLTYFIPYVGYLIPGVFWYGTAAAIHFITIVVMSFSLYFFNGRQKRDLFLALLFALPCVIWVFRTSIMGTTLALMLFFLFRYKLKALPFIFGILCLFVAAIFFIPSVKEKMFFDKTQASVSQVQSGEINMDNINSNGRFAMWKWSLERFYEPSPLIGSGTGNLQEVFYSLKHPFARIKICHNDYVQILCDNGLIGLILYAAAFLYLIFHCFIVYQGRRHLLMVRVCALIAGPAMGGTMLTMYTDNVINYTMATISFPCAIYGMMLGLLQTEKKKRYAL